MIFKCLTCGKNIKSRPSMPRKYCSRKCQPITTEARAKMSQAKINNPTMYWKGKKRPEIKQWLVGFKKGHVPWNKGKAMVCIQEEKHPLWKGGITGYRRIMKRKIGIEECQLCGSNRYLQVHHRDKNRANNSLKNIMILCAKCHWHEDRDKKEASS